MLLSESHLHNILLENIHKTLNEVKRFGIDDYFNAQERRKKNKGKPKEANPQQALIKNAKIFLRNDVTRALNFVTCIDRFWNFANTVKERYPQDFYLLESIENLHFYTCLPLVREYEKVKAIVFNSRKWGDIIGNIRELRYKLENAMDALYDFANALQDPSLRVQFKENKMFTNIRPHMGLFRLGYWIEQTEGKEDLSIELLEKIAETDYLSYDYTITPKAKKTPKKQATTEKSKPEEPKPAKKRGRPKKATVPVEIQPQQSVEDEEVWTPFSEWNPQNQRGFKIGKRAKPPYTAPSVKHKQWPVYPPRKPYSTPEAVPFEVGDFPEAKAIRDKNIQNDLEKQAQEQAKKKTKSRTKRNKAKERFVNNPITKARNAKGTYHPQRNADQENRNGVIDKGLGKGKSRRN